MLLHLTRRAVADLEHKLEQGIALGFDPEIIRSLRAEGEHAIATALDADIFEHTGVYRAVLEAKAVASLPAIRDCEWVSTWRPVPAGHDRIVCGSCEVAIDIRGGAVAGENARRMMARHRERHEVKPAYPGRRGGFLSRIFFSRFGR